MILPLTDLAGCKVFAERLRKRVEDMEFFIAGTSVRITISLGLTTFEPSMMVVSKSQMMNVADAALYQAKQNGRNRVGVM